MGFGILIIFYNNGQIINKNLFETYLSSIEQPHICLINNGSNDNTLEKLLELKDKCQQIRVIDIKRKKSNTGAIKAGVRYLLNATKFKIIGYFSLEESNSLEMIIKLLPTVLKKEDMVINHYDLLQKEKRVNRVLFKNVFSILDYKNILEL